MASEGREFDRLIAVIQRQQQLINSIATKLEKIESIGGGGGTASIEDYKSGMNYKRNMLVVDQDTETVYRVIDEYVSVTVKEDCAKAHLKLVGFESQIVTLNHEPTQKETDALPDDSLVAIYSTTEKYTPTSQG